jgi:hypothetical protein
MDEFFENPKNMDNMASPIDCGPHTTTAALDAQLARRGRGKALKE